MIQAVIFDLDQTLLDRSATFRAFAIKQHQRFSSELNSCDVEQYWAAMNQLDDNGYKDKRIMFQEVCELLELSIDPHKLYNDFKQRYGSNPVLFAGVTEMLETLKGCYQLAVITNGRTKAQGTKIRVSGLVPYFDEVTISESVGVKKPSPQIFHHCLSRLGISAENCVYIGDNPKNDVEAAKAVGMKALWIKNPHFDPPTQCDGVVESWDDLYSFLKED